MAAETTAAYLDLVGNTSAGMARPRRSTVIGTASSGQCGGSGQIVADPSGRALAELGSKDFAPIPQAKGEWSGPTASCKTAWSSFMRLSGIASWEAGNAFLPDFLAEYNARFGQPPGNPRMLMPRPVPRNAYAASLCLKRGTQAVPATHLPIHQQWLHILPPKGGEPAGGRHGGTSAPIWTAPWRSSMPTARLYERFLLLGLRPP